MPEAGPQRPDHCRDLDKRRWSVKSVGSGTGWSRALEWQARGHSRALALPRCWGKEQHLPPAAGLASASHSGRVLWVRVFPLTKRDEAAGGGPPVAAESGTVDLLGQRALPPHSGLLVLPQWGLPHSPCSGLGLQRLLFLQGQIFWSVVSGGGGGGVK